MYSAYATYYCFAVVGNVALIGNFCLLLFLKKKRLASIVTLHIKFPFHFYSILGFLDNNISLLKVNHIHFFKKLLA